MRHGVLSQKRRLQADFGADPFAFGVGCVGGMIAAASAAELRAEVGGLDLIELLDLLPGFVAARARDVDFELQNGHSIALTGGLNNHPRR